MIIDWRLIEFEEDEPWLDRSKTQPDKFSKKMNGMAANFLSEIFISKICADLKNELGIMPNVHIDETDGNQARNRTSCRMDTIPQKRYSLLCIRNISRNSGR